MTLTIESYAAAEAEGLAAVSNIERAAFAPSTFTELNCPVSVAVESDLLRFVDSMHEFSAGDYFKADCPLSPDEADLIRRVGDHVVAWTAAHLGRAVRPWVAPLSAVEMFRVVSATARALGKDRLTVLEIGPGSGYLGALLHLAGHRHISMDNTQAYYLWQNRLYGSLAGDGFAELADPAAPLVDDPAKTMVHLPWWRFAQLHDAGFPFAVDLVVCDHALNEIDTVALRYILRACHAMLSRVEDGMLLFCGAGHGQKRREPQLFREFDRAGFSALFKRLFYGVGLKGGRLDPLAIPAGQVTATDRWTRARILLRRRALAARFPALLALDAAVPRHNPSGRPGTVRPAACVPIRRAEAPPGYGFVAAAGYFVPPFSE